MSTQARTPRVSVIVPSYNHAAYLSQRLDSILAQRFTDIEIILLDDASSDASQSICQRFARTHRCTLRINPENSGSAFRQWHAGISLARGQYLWIAESDDVCTPEFLETLVDRLDRHPECGLAYSESRCIDEQGKSISLASTSFSEAPAKHWAHDFVANGVDELRAGMLLENTIPNASAVLFRRTCYDAVGGVDTSMQLCADWLLWASLLSVAHVAYVAAPLNHFRTHRQSVRSASKTWPRTTENLATMQRIAELITLSRTERRQIGLRATILLLDSLMQKWPTLSEFQAAVEAARALQAEVSPATLAQLLMRIPRSVLKRIAHA